jgi:hypothetical protein
MTRAKKEVIELESDQVKVTLLKTIQISPNSEPLKPGVHTLNESLAEELYNAGVLSEEFD